MADTGSSLQDRIPWLSAAVHVRRSELPGLAGGFLYFFFLLCSYYMLRPVRDEMGVEGGVENLQWLFTATFVTMLAAIPLFAAAVRRFPRRRLIPVVYGFFIACIGAFWAWLESGVAAAWAARVFFVWLSVFNLFVISVFWSFMADVFDHRQAARLFGVIAAGGSAGAILGPGIAAALAHRVGPAPLLLLAAGVLALTLPCVAALGRWQHRRVDGGPGPADDGDAALGGSLLEGVRAVTRSRYLIGICGFIWLYTTLATFLYFTQAEILAAAIPDRGDRTSVFATIDLATNVLTLGVQLFATARLVERLGLARALALVPGLVALGFMALAAVPTLLAIAVVQVIRRAGNYAVAKPGREMLFTVVSRMEKYKAKNFIDTVVYRGGDAIAGWAFAGLSALGLGLAGTALVALPLALLWLVVGYWLGRGHAGLARILEQEARHEISPVPQSP